MNTSKKMPNQGKQELKEKADCRRAFELGGVLIEPGERKEVNLSVARLYDHTEMKIPVKVLRGYEDGPCLFVSAAIHGDEINGVEIIRRLLHQKSLRRLRGTLIAVPIVNVFGFNSRTRYLPDRRDLNRSFPGSAQGSLASQLAYLFMHEIVDRCTHGIDFHSATQHRVNLPQIRASLDEPETRRLAEAFGAPVVLNSTLRDGSLRQAAADLNIPMLLFEGGEALRFEERVIQVGLRGALATMRAIGMLPPPKMSSERKQKESFITRSSVWVRAAQSGIQKPTKKLGSVVEKGDLLGVISNPFGSEEVEILASRSGVIIGTSVLPLVNRGDAVFHIATIDDLSSVEETIENFGDFVSDPMESW